ncbi:PREDICTED: acylsugar acyltransferase 3-like [Nicotiana attenuata]|uniref:Acylsugar acyltransferase 3 n=1 Tax=Nicotiana attenuata TaxID=49451 RepID=A0A314KKX0_NICAT|nr:PREDICTED: acylsugar acyltransferase 3-like [Nicotiana attenuata]OIT29898.1 acylsugar acyltransferase 3 [Nicotiana attenuata]
MAASALLSSPSLVSISDKSFIKPSTLTPSTVRLHKLSLVDQSFSNMYIPFAFFYPKQQKEESNNSQLSHIADLLQRSLSQTLVSYYPYAGKLRDNATVECNDMGAEFLSVQIKCPMSEILNHPHATDAESIVFPKDLPWKNNYEGGNLLVVQLSKFDCGGIAISICLSHKIGDGCSVINFLNDWASVTRDHRFVVPSPRFVADSIFSSLNGPLIAPHIMSSNVSECVQKRLVFPTAKLDALRAKIAVESGVENPTRSEVVSALVYKCATKAAVASTSANIHPSKLVHYLDVRTMIKPRLPRSAIGNLLSVFSTAATQDIELPRLVHNMRKEVEVAYKKDQVQQNELLLEVVESMKKGKLAFEEKDENCTTPTTMYFCSNLCKFPFYSVDFGWGKPERVCLGTGPFANFFFLKDYQTGRGVEARVTLQKQHMSAFERDEELLQFASSSAPSL